MRVLIRFVGMLCLLSVVVFPLSARTVGPRELEAPETREALDSRPAMAKLGRLQKSLTCEITCNNGDHASKTVETRGGCLDACESFCGGRCVLVN